MSIFFICNGKFFPEGTPVITAGNHSFRYGDGLFETIKAAAGKLILADYHFERLFEGLQYLGFDIPETFTPVYLKGEISRALKKNDPGKFAGVRLIVFRGDGGLGNPENHLPNYIIQVWPLGDFIFNNEGLVIDIFKNGRKSTDGLANLKTNNFLLYTLAAISAKKNNLDDCLLLNNNERICETSIANIFIVKDKKIFTPPLSEGCIAGVMRKWLLEKIRIKGSPIIEKPLDIEQLEHADEIFLTNSIHPLRWVKQFKNVQYTNIIARYIYEEIITTF